jgi:hypothetical protein
MTNFMDRYGAQLLRYGRGLGATSVIARPPRRWRSRRTGAIALVIIAVGAPALAATQPWQPLLGRPELHAVPAGTSATSPPTDQLAVLGVLRRSQTAADRGPVTVALLRHLGIEQGGVRTSSIRLLTSAAGAHAVLVSIEHNANVAGNEPIEHDQLCLLFEGGGSCGGLPSLLAGKWLVLLGPHLLGLVPDGVAAVELQYADHQTRTTTARDNFFEVDDAPVASRQIGAPGAGPARPLETAAPPVLRWLDANGRPIGPPLST